MERSATRIFGFAEAEALGQSLDLIVPERLRARHWEGYDRVMAGGDEPLWRGRAAGGAGDAPGRQTDLDRIHHIADARRRRRAAGIAAFLRDVTARFEEMRALRRELAALKAQAERG